LDEAEELILCVLKRPEEELIICVLKSIGTHGMHSQQSCRTSVLDNLYICETFTVKNHATSTSGLNSFHIRARSEPHQGHIRATSGPHQDHIRATSGPESKTTLETQ